MARIVNFILSVFVMLFGIWVLLFGRTDFESPLFKWLNKCLEDKKSRGEVAWNEFLAMMNYLRLHYVERHSDAEELNRYSNYVNISDYFTYIQQEKSKIPDQDNTFSEGNTINQRLANQFHDNIEDDEKTVEDVIDNKVWWQEEYKPYTAFEPHKKQIDNNALKESIISMIDAHRQRYKEEVDKTVKTILKPKLFPRANIQLFSDSNQLSVLKIIFNKTVETDSELLEKMKKSQYLKMFVIDETESDNVSLIIDFHNNEKLMQTAILEILTAVYDQPQDCAISYVNNVSGYTMQEQGITNSSGCSLWTWLGILVVLAIIVWMLL